MDIDIDFETGRRDEVIEYVEKKYQGHTARIASYGLYKLDNLVNDLAKVCGLPTDKNVDEYDASNNKKEIANIKKLCKMYIDEDGKLDPIGLLSNPESVYYNKTYDNLITHFTKLYGKVRFIGTHAAGIAVTGGDILDYTALRVDKSGSLYANYDLNDIEHIHVVKFDMLGLNTMAEIRELREETGATVDYDTVVTDKKVIQSFTEGNIDGIFQFGTKTPKKILEKIGCDCFDDIVATNAMNRPGPLSLNMPDAYAENKQNLGTAKDTLYYPYTKESYGTIIYQEQIQQICVYLGNMSWPDADRVMKMISNGASGKDKREATEKEMREKFLTGAKANGLSKKDAESIFNAMLVYSFNKGHACGYSLISMEEMFYKVYYPIQFWFGKIKYAPNADMFDKLCAGAAKSGCVVFLPHINYSSIKTRIRKVEGEFCLQQGLADIKGIGDKAATEIFAERKQNGIFTSFDNFYDRCKGRVVNERVIKILKENGNAEFNKDTYINRVTKYNAALLQRSM